jgi:hypothetical protein
MADQSTNVENADNGDNHDQARNEGRKQDQHPVLPVRALRPAVHAGSQSVMIQNFVYLL